MELRHDKINIFLRQVISEKKEIFQDCGILLTRNTNHKSTINQGH